MVRRRAVEALGFSSNAEVVAVIRDAYEDGDPDLRTSALVAMGRSADRRWRKIVLHELDSPYGQVRLEAARACGELELREAVLPLTRLVEQDKNSTVRRAAVGALGRAGGPTAKKVLDLILSTEDGPLYDAAQDAMEELRFAAECPEVADLLRSVDDDDDEDVYDSLEEPAGLFDDYAEEYDDEEEDEDEDEGWDEDAGDFHDHLDAEDYDEDSEDEESAV
jgi:HEAT repeat protein